MNTVIYEETQHLPRISWGAIFAGVALASVIYLVFSVLGSAIGASVFEPLREANPLSGFPFAAGVWLAITTVISLVAGGYFAGRAAQTLGWLHGLLTWALVTLATTYLLTAAAGSIISTSASVLGKGIAVVGEGVAKAAPAAADKVKSELQQSGINIDFDSLKSEFDTLLMQTGKPELNPNNLQQKTAQAKDDAKGTAQQAAETPQQGDVAFKQWFDRVKQSAQPALSAADKEALVNIIAARTGKSHEESQQIADNYERTYNQALANYQAAKQQAEQKARAAADAAAKNLARASWWTFALLILGAIVAGAAGNLGFRHQPVVEDRPGRDEVVSARAARI
ncbi:MAG: putative rane protein [Verrucomicrobiaceae bacterium]|nr:putative rane protein [Verrucomicrobiaceae bacterium]